MVETVVQDPVGRNPTDGVALRILIQFNTERTIEEVADASLFDEFKEMMLRERQRKSG